MTNDERYGQVYGAALGRALDELWEWMAWRSPVAPASLETAFSHVDRVARVSPAPTRLFCRAARDEAGIDDLAAFESADELLERGHSTWALRLAHALERLDPEYRGIQSALILGKSNDRAEALTNLAEIVRDGTRTDDARTFALICLSELDADAFVVELALELLRAIPVSNRRFIYKTADVLTGLFFEAESAAGGNAPEEDEALDDLTPLLN